MTTQRLTRATFLLAALIALAAVVMAVFSSGPVADSSSEAQVQLIEPQPLTTDTASTTVTGTKSGKSRSNTTQKKQSPADTFPAADSPLRHPVVSAPQQ